MSNNIVRLEESIFKKAGFSISNMEADLECAEYLGYNFYLNKLPIKFRKAKQTPKKIGQFVTLWKRNASSETEPFHATDPFLFYIIVVDTQSRHGFFIFPKAVLIREKILTSPAHEGKRGFRVYPEWDLPGSKQAEKTKAWQREFFIDLKNDNDQESQLQLKRILTIS